MGLPAAREGRISLGTPMMRLIPVPENDFRVNGTGLKTRTFEMPLDVRRLMTSDGRGRLSATRP